MSGIDDSRDPKRIRRGARAEATPALIDFLCKQYGFDQDSPITDLGGSCSLNLLLKKQGELFVARVYLPCVSSARLDGMQIVKNKLRSTVPCAETLNTVEGLPYIGWDGRLVEAERYVRHDAFMKTWARLEEGMPYLGRIHSALEGLALSAEALYQPFVNHISAERALEMTKKGVSRIRSLSGITDEERQIADRAEALAHRLASLEFPLPMQLTHGDFWDNNVFFNKGKIVLVGDFDFMCVRPRIEDIALTFYFADAEFTLFQPDAEDHKSMLASLLRAYNGGLKIPLGSDDLAALPLAMARQPLWCIGGWCVQAEHDNDVRIRISDMLYYVDWAHKIIDELDEWHQVFSFALFHTA